MLLKLVAVVLMIIIMTVMVIRTKVTVYCTSTGDGKDIDGRSGDVAYPVPLCRAGTFSSL